MNTVKVRNIEIGSGVPKICVPIVGVTKDEIIAEAKTFDSIPVDVVEWRVDWFEGVFEFDKVEDVLKDLREALGETPILFTFRTSKEGGEKAIEAQPYKELNIAAAKTGYVDLVDVDPVPVFGGQFFEHRCEGLAGTAPRGVEVDQGGFVTEVFPLLGIFFIVGDLLQKVGFGQCDRFHILCVFVVCLCLASGGEGQQRESGYEQFFHLVFLLFSINNDAKIEFIFR